MSPPRESILDAKRAWLAARAQRLVESAAKPDVAITDVEAIAVREPVGKRSYVIVTIATDAGVSGFGETAAGADPLAAVRRFMAQKSHLTGRDATAFEAVRHSLSRVDAFDGIQGAVNMALLDILGKLAKAPVYEVLGGPTRTKARALAGFDVDSGASAEAAVRAAVESGFRAFLVRGTMLRAFSARVTADGRFRAGGRAFFRELRVELESLRAAAGDGADFVLDCGGLLSPGEAAGVARELERFHLLWLEEPTGPVQRNKSAEISAESVTPVGYGRGITGHRDVQELLRSGAVDVLRPDIREYGITRIRKAAALAETHYVAMAPSHRGGPVATAATLHVAASLPNFFIQEVPFSMDARDVRMRRELVGDDLEVVRDGFLALPSKPGLGVALNEGALRTYQVKA